MHAPERPTTDIGGAKTSSHQGWASCMFFSLADGVWRFSRPIINWYVAENSERAELDRRSSDECQNED